MNNYDIIIEPILSEKSTDGIAEKKYTFKVAKSATKTDVKRAVEAVLGVKVAKVNTMNVHGKAKRMGAARPGRTKDWKQAVVQLAEDSKSIELFEGMVQGRKLKHVYQNF